MQRQSDNVAVITGTSSGIGKATALAFAQTGVRIAMGARRERQLQETAAACRAAGADTVSLVMDVADEGQVEELADLALETFGRFDVWINNAGMDTFGNFEDVPTATMERLLQVNLMGTIHGAKAALAHFRERGSGVLINNASMVGACPSPFHSAYVASKFAIRGLSHSLRQELTSFPDIHVCVISPASIDTPLWQRAANYSGRKVKPIDPVHPADVVAEMMVELAKNPQREVFAGASGWMLAEQYGANPEMTEVLVGSFVRNSLFQDEPAEPTDGAVFEPENGNGGVSGGWLDPDRPVIPASDLLSLLTAPALLAAAPQLYTLHLWYDFLQHFGRHLAPSQVARQLSSAAR